MNSNNDICNTMNFQYIDAAGSNINGPHMPANILISDDEAVSAAKMLNARYVTSEVPISGPMPFPYKPTEGFIDELGSTTGEKIATVALWLIALALVYCLFAGCALFTTSSGASAASTGTSGTTGTTEVITTGLPIADQGLMMQTVQ